jgi:hypothetical protein
MKNTKRHLLLSSIVTNLCVTSFIIGTILSLLLDLTSSLVNIFISQMDEVAEEIENELTLIGATAIEDKLQLGVADCICNLRKVK